MGLARWRLPATQTVSLPTSWVQHQHTGLTSPPPPGDTLGSPPRAGRHASPWCPVSPGMYRWCPGASFAADSPPTSHAGPLHPLSGISVLGLRPQSWWLRPAGSYCRCRETGHQGVGRADPPRVCGGATPGLLAVPGPVALSLHPSLCLPLSGLYSFHQLLKPVLTHAESAPPPSGVTSPWSLLQRLRSPARPQSQRGPPPVFGGHSLVHGVGLRWTWGRVPAGLARVEVSTLGPEAPLRGPAWLPPPQPAEHCPPEARLLHPRAWMPPASALSRRGYRRSFSGGPGPRPRGLPLRGLLWRRDVRTEGRPGEKEERPDCLGPGEAGQPWGSKGGLAELAGFRLRAPCTRGQRRAGWALPGPSWGPPGMPLVVPCPHRPCRGDPQGNSSSLQAPLTRFPSACAVGGEREPRGGLPAHRPAPEGSEGAGQDWRGWLAVLTGGKAPESRWVMSPSSCRVPAAGGRGWGPEKPGTHHPLPLLPGGPGPRGQQGGLGPREEAAGCPGARCRAPGALAGPVPSEPRAP